MRRAGADNRRSVIARRILVVDDDQLMTDMLGQALPDIGYEVSTCACGEEALKLLRAGSYDLIILDLAMPGTSGVDLITEIRSERSSTPVMVLSGYVGSLEERRLTELGVAAVLRKPAKLKLLVETIEKLLDSGGAAAEPAAEPG
jgi:DNA-binding response OmpR family regulator